MKRIINSFSAILVCLALAQTTVQASSHREAPLISNDPLADNTDLYVFKSPCDTGKIVIIANYIPFEHPAGGPNYYNFGENIRYEIHIKNKTTTTGDDITYRFTFKHVYQDSSTFFNIRLGKQNLKTTYTLEKSANGSGFLPVIIDGIVPPNNIGPRSIESSPVGLGTPYDTLMARAFTNAGSGERVFCGPIDDPFFVDLGGAFDVGGFRANGRDAAAKNNCHSIVMEIPVRFLQKDFKFVSQATSILDPEFVIGVYASASRRELTTFNTGGVPETVSGNWIQVSRLGMPLTNEAVIPIGSKDQWNSTLTGAEGSFDKYFKNPELALYMDGSQFGGAVPGLYPALRIQSSSLGAFDFRNGKKGLYNLKGTPAVAGTALDNALFGNYLLPDSTSPRAVDLLPIFQTGVPNLAPYQLATGKPANSPLSAGKPFINNFLPTFGDMLRLNMAVPATPRNDPKFSSLGLVYAAVLGLTDPAYNGSAALQFIPNMDGFPNGRRLEDDVTTIELQAVGGVVLAAIGLWYDDYPGSGSPVTAQLGSVLGFQAGVTKNDTTFRECFPYVQGPWKGFTGPGYVGPISGDILPVNFLSFTAEKSAEKVLLTWKVAEASNVDHYEVEYSLDGRTFTSIGTLRSNGLPGDKTYTLLHGTPSTDRLNYYRIKEVDKDASVTISPIRLVKFNTKAVLTISPNPAKDFINMYSNEQRLTINFYDAAGRKITTQVLNGSGRFNVSNLAKGVYLVVAEKDGKILESQRIVKQ